MNRSAKVLLATGTLAVAVAASVIARRQVCHLDGCATLTRKVESLWRDDAEAHRQMKTMAESLSGDSNVTEFEQRLRQFSKLTASWNGPLDLRVSAPDRLFSDEVWVAYVKFRANGRLGSVRFGTLDSLGLDELGLRDRCFGSPQECEGFPSPK